MPNSQGHAARRRSGAPANAYGDLGAVNGAAGRTHHDAYDEAVLANSPRIAMGGSAYAASAPSAMPSPNTLPRPKAKGPAGDLSAAPGGKRTPILAEKLGARYAIAVKTPAPFDQAAGPTMASARAVPSIKGRQAPNFQSGNEGSY